VAEIFRQRGERAFRALEAGALESLRGRSRLVVATGGGAPAEPGNRWFFERAAVFHLRVSLPSMRERTSGNRDRPLLALGESQLGALYESRRPIYEALGRGVDTDGRSPPDVAAEILDILRGPGGLMDPTRRRLEDSGGQGPSA